LKAAVDGAIANNGWVIMLTHSHLIDATELQKLSDLIDYAQGLNVPILKLTDALKYKGNVVATGEYTNINSTFVGVNGSAKIGLQTGLEVAGNTTINNMDALITAYKKDFVSISLIPYTKDTLLGVGGLLYTFRALDSDTWSYQTFKPLTSNRVYMRLWFTGGSWKTWKLVSSNIEINGTVGGVVAQPITYFPNDTVSVFTVNNNEVTAPIANQGGVYTVYRFTGDTFSYAEYKMLASNAKYSRRWVSSAWTAWEKVSAV
jgi:hypothetical protein